MNPDLQPTADTEAEAEASRSTGAAPAADATWSRSDRVIRTVVIGTAVLGVTFGAIVGVVSTTVIVPALAGGASSHGPTHIEAAAAECDVEGNAWITVGDDGRSLSMKSDGAESAGADIEDVACMLLELDVPDSVVSRIDSTRALDGRQDAEWDDFSASWGYHPDNGLDIVIETVEP